jgi:hypothetical protein
MFLVKIRVISWTCFTANEAQSRFLFGLEIASHPGRLANKLKTVREAIAAHEDSVLRVRILNIQEKRGSYETGTS